MNYEYHQSFFSRAVLTSVFVGFVATIVCLVFNIAFRESTGYRPADFINVSSLIFVVNFIFLVVGLLYYAYLKTVKKSDAIFSVVVAVLTLLCIWRASQATMLNNQHLTSEFRTLLIGVIVILGLGASFFVPYLFRHKKIMDKII